MVTRTFIAVMAVALGGVVQPGGAVAQDKGGVTVDAGGLVLPAFDAARGRMLFASKGCVVCHSINGIGGTDAPDISANHMERPMNPFDFVAKMWKGAPAMIAMQEDELGGQIQFTGDELADIIAFVHNPAEQAKFSEDDIPPEIRKHLDEGGMGEMGEHMKGGTGETMGEMPMHKKTP